MTVVEAAASLLIGAGIVAGIIEAEASTVAGVYPALLAVGTAPLPASIANLVAGVVMGPARRSLAARAGRNPDQPLRLLPVSILGTIAGADSYW